MQDVPKKKCVVSGPKGLPVLGMLPDIIRDPLKVLSQNAVRYGDIIPINTLGFQTLQINHPDLVKYILVENHKNYRKSDVYIRFEPLLGKGLVTSEGEKWRRDRQKIQPVFKREQIEVYYFDIVNEVTEKYKRRWLALTEKGSAELDISHEMAAITMEVIVKLLFGKDTVDEKGIETLYHAYTVFMDYTKSLRILPKVDLRKLFCAPAYFRFKKELDYVQATFRGLLEQYKRNYHNGTAKDRQSMLALMVEAQQQDPEHFSEQDIIDHFATMVFGGFESTGLSTQWMWYALDGRPDIAKKLRDDIISHAPCTATLDSSGLTYDEVARMEYLSAVFAETLRLYPPFWAIGRAPLEDDYLGDFKVKRGTVIVLSPMIMHRHPRWWSEPNAFIPERFSLEKQSLIDPGLYFPFAQGPRKCIGARSAEIEAKAIFTKLLPLFNVTALNTLSNPFDLGISLKLKHPLRVEIRRI